MENRRPAHQLIGQLTKPPTVCKYSLGSTNSRMFGWLGVDGVRVTRVGIKTRLIVMGGSDKADEKKQNIKHTPRSSQTCFSK